MMPLRYGMPFSPRTNFLVHVSVSYSDGSVSIVHAGVEIGQGINTKVRNIHKVQLLKITYISSHLNNLYIISFSTNNLSPNYSFT